MGLVGTSCCTLTVQVLVRSCSHQRNLCSQLRKADFETVGMGARIGTSLLMIGLFQPGSFMVACVIS